MLKENLLIPVAHDECGISGIEVERDMIGREAMPKAILGRALGLPFHAGFSALFTLAIFVGDVVGFDEQTSAFESFTASVHELPIRQIESTGWCALQPFP
jgi:hypothetical protein